ncbi:restriction endonuclease [Burkholderiaceae bacterium]|nr:restriction endonuclease [Burkholderiaceae bacterium]
MTPIEYEIHCKNLLIKAGWRAISTPKSGDQGADVICISGSHKLVVQCKLYSQPVGNSAVQEVISARIFYEADLAAVVTNVGFTSSAKTLALKADVALLNDSMLEAWGKKNLKSKHVLPTTTFEILGVLNASGIKATKHGKGFQVRLKSGQLINVASEGALHAFASSL